MKRPTPPDIDKYLTDQIKPWTATWNQATELKKQISEIEMAHKIQVEKETKELREQLAEAEKALQALRDSVDETLADVTTETGAKKWLDGLVVTSERKRVKEIVDPEKFALWCRAQNLLAMPDPKSVVGKSLLNLLIGEKPHWLVPNETEGKKMLLAVFEDRTFDTKEVAGVECETFVTKMGDDKWEKVMNTLSLMVFVDEKQTQSEDL